LLPRSSENGLDFLKPEEGNKALPYDIRVLSVAPAAIQPVLGAKQDQQSIKEAKTEQIGKMFRGDVNLTDRRVICARRFRPFMTVAVRCSKQRAKDCASLDHAVCSCVR
jgi:hypothetical protein